MNQYTFPFNTCEKTQKHGIAQPYSSYVNLLNCAIIFYFLVQTKKFYTFFLLFSILCFEAFHTLSHMLHIQGMIQTYMVHALTYVINAAFFYAFYSYTRVFPNNVFLFYLVMLVCFDLYALFHLSLGFYIMSQALILISLLVYYFPMLPAAIQSGIYRIVFVVICTTLLIFNESYNCKTMMRVYPHFPYHVIIEAFGVLLFYLVSSRFYNL